MGEVLQPKTTPEALALALSLKASAEYRGASLIRNTPSVGLCSRPMPKGLWWSQGGGCLHPCKARAIWGHSPVYRGTSLVRKRPPF